ncbi:MAG TPA: hypothetical protein VFN03_04200 [Trueperaceae bacterium]|nr:hypothetical protein [Trueperaceae bacterium]
MKVVSERLGHANVAFTMHTYQHLLPGMSAAAARRNNTPTRRTGRRERKSTAAAPAAGPSTNEPTQKVA